MSGETGDPVRSILIQVLKTQLYMFETGIHQNRDPRFVEENAGGDEIGIEPAIGSLFHQLFQVAARRGFAAGEMDLQAAERRRFAEDAGIPLGRFGRAAEFADLGCFLLSPRASYLTGTAINLDGGLSPVV